jgi:hypothetical protein
MTAVSAPRGAQPEAKYEFTDNAKHVRSFARWIVVRQIRAIRDFGNVKTGTLGGWLESERNLDHRQNSWVEDDAVVCEYARITSDAKVSQSAKVSGRAVVAGNAEISDWAQVTDNAYVAGKSIIRRGAIVNHNAHVVTALDGTPNIATKPIIYISGLQYPVTITDNCITTMWDKCYTFGDWFSLSGDSFTEISHRGIHSQVNSFLEKMLVGANRWEMLR